MFNNTVEKVCLVGSGNWGSCISKIVGLNVQRLYEQDPSRWDPKVTMWVYEEILETEPGKKEKLTEIINDRHENVKYLPGIKLPTNVVAIANLEDAVQEATLLVFVLPHQFIRNICRQLVGKVAPGARAISLAKGIETCDDGKRGLTLLSFIISHYLHLDVSVLMGANLASDLAQERFSEATIGFNCAVNGAIWKELFEQPTYFRLTLVKDVVGVELSGALKNIIAMAAGFIDGIYYDQGGGTNNTKAAIIRKGLLEMRLLCRLINANTRDETFLESCGIADLIASSYGGRNRRVAEAMVITGRSVNELEDELLSGQKLQGPPTAYQVYYWLQEQGLLDRFPLMIAVYKICYEKAPPGIIIDALRN